jgi:hypothetical protein
MVSIVYHSREEQTYLKHPTKADAGEEAVDTAIRAEAITTFSVRVALVLEMLETRLVLAVGDAGAAACNEAFEHGYQDGCTESRKNDEQVPQSPKQSHKPCDHSRWPCPLYGLFLGFLLPPFVVIGA